MLLSITIIFIIGNVLEPLAFTPVYRGLFGPAALLQDSYMNFRAVTNALEAITYMSNFPSYCIFNPYFTATLRAMLLCHKVDVSVDVSSHGRVSQSHHGRLSVERRPTTLHNVWQEGRKVSQVVPIVWEEDGKAGPATPTTVIEQLNPPLPHGGVYVGESSLSDNQE